MATQIHWCPSQSTVCFSCIAAIRGLINSHTYHSVMVKIVGVAKVSYLAYLNRVIDHSCGNTNM